MASLSRLRERVGARAGSRHALPLMLALTRNAPHPARLPQAGDGASGMLLIPPVLFYRPAPQLRFPPLSLRRHAAPGNLPRQASAVPAARAADRRDAGLLLLAGGTGGLVLDAARGSVRA